MTTYVFTNLNDPAAASIIPNGINDNGQIVGSEIVSGAIGLRRNRDALDQTGGVGEIEGPEILKIVAELESDKACVEDLGAVNRWPARSEVPIEEYFHFWQASCAEIRAPGRLPVRLAKSLCLR
jgi:hypothetical protein